MAAAATIGANTWAAQPNRAAQQEVTVCIERPPSARDLPRAELLAAKMFAPIGVKLHWRPEGSCHTEDAIRIGISVKTPADESPGALAYAMAYEGVHIVVFYDRIRGSVGDDLRTPVLAHVLVHEITHVLQNIDRHSESGVMKAHWTEDDFAQMRVKPLPFTGWDIELIQHGLESRRLRVAARNVTAQIPFP